MAPRQDIRRITRVVAMSEPVRRREYLTIRALKAGANMWIVKEAVSSTALAHGAGWLDEMVDLDTGEPVGGDTEP